MDQILIKGLLGRRVIGISENERAQPQDILVNVVIFTDITRASETDVLDDTVNYRTMSKMILAHIETARRYTVEALAGDIARMLLAENGVRGVRVRVEKPGAFRFSRSVGVEIERFNP
jgi:FolB domain-containing protein